MKPETKQLVDKGERSLKAAQLLAADGFADFAISRAYYAMFYAAEAMLLERELSFSKHGGVIGAFGREFAKSEAIDPKYHRFLRAAFDKRALGDYEAVSAFTDQDAQDVLEQGREFLEMARTFLGDHTT